MTWVFLKWLLLPLIKVGLREILKEELKLLTEAAKGIKDCAEDWSDMSDDLYTIESEVHNLNVNVHANREWMQEFSLVLDNILGIERRKRGDNTPVMPPLPDMQAPIRARPRRRRSSNG